METEENMQNMQKKEMETKEMEMKEMGKEEKQEKKEEKEVIEDTSRSVAPMHCRAASSSWCCDRDGLVSKRKPENGREWKIF